MSAWAIVLAGGAGTRFGGEVPKQYLDLEGRPVLAHALDRLLSRPEVEGAVVPSRPQDAARLDALVAALGRPEAVRVVPGGATRQASVAAGLAALPTEAEWVLVHDGARPWPGAAMLDRLLAARGRARAVIPGLAVTDTIKRVDEAGRVVDTLDRARLRAVQTPQLFAVDLLRRAHRDGPPGATDDARLVEQAGEEVLVVDGDPGNLKVTRPGDLDLLTAWAGRGAAP